MLQKIEHGKVLRTGTSITADSIGLRNRPLAKLNIAVKIADASDEGEAESKAVSTIAIAFGKDTESFDKTDGMFHKDAFL